VGRMPEVCVAEVPGKHKEELFRKLQKKEIEKMKKWLKIVSVIFLIGFTVMAFTKESKAGESSSPPDELLSLIRVLDGCQNYCRGAKWNSAYQYLSLLKKSYAKLLPQLVSMGEKGKAGSFGIFITKLEKSIQRQNKRDSERSLIVLLDMARSFQGYSQAG